MSPDAGSLLDAARALRAGSATAVGLTAAALAQVSRWEDATTPLGALLSRFDETALEAAQRADDELARGVDRGPLHGVPVVVKDLLLSVEGATTGHSRVPLPAGRRLVDAPAVARLRDAGAVVVGKATMSEFACGAPAPDAGLPLPRNPWDLDRWPGGSSSGTGAAVAARLVPAGLGSDTGGSIRIPAACCGITGLKPTFGLVPADGCLPMAWSLDTVGPMATTAADCAVVLAALTASAAAGAAWATELPGGSTGDLSGVRVGVERRHHGVGVGADGRVVAHVDDAVGELVAAGADVVEVELDAGLVELAAAAKDVITWSEAFEVHRETMRSYWDDYGPLTRLMIAQGAFVAAADYVRAQRVRTLVRARVARLFEQVDVVITPTIGVPAPRLDADFVALMPLFFTGLWNLTGNPAVSVPVAPVDGLPVGMQIAGRDHDEATVLRVAGAFQRRTAWHRASPAAGR